MSVEYSKYWFSLFKAAEYSFSLYRSCASCKRESVADAETESEAELVCESVLFVLPVLSVSFAETAFPVAADFFEEDVSEPFEDSAFWFEEDG